MTPKMPTSSLRLVHISCPNRELAESIARHLVTAGLAATVHALPVDSFYRWDEKVVHNNEIALVARTDASRTAEIINHVMAVHPYEVPSVIETEITGGSDAYLNWVSASVVGG